MLRSLKIKKISRLKSIKRQRQLSVSCLFAALHVHLRWKRRSGIRPHAASKPTGGRGLAQRRAAGPQRSLKGFVRLHPEVSGDPRGLWGHEYSYWKPVVRKRRYKNAAL